MASKHPTPGDPHADAVPNEEPIAQTLRKDNAVTAIDAANNRSTVEVVDETAAPNGEVSSPLDGRVDFGRLGWTCSYRTNLARQRLIGASLEIVLIAALEIPVRCF